MSKQQNPHDLSHIHLFVFGPDSNTTGNFSACIVHSMCFGRVLFQQRSAETVYWHLHHPAKTINRFLCLLIVFLKSKTHQLNLKDMITLNRNLW